MNFYIPFTIYCNIYPSLKIVKININTILLGFRSGSVVKIPPVKQETQVQSLGQEDPLEEEMATHPSILAWNPMDRGARGPTVHGVKKSWTQLGD